MRYTLRHRKGKPVFAPGEVRVIRELGVHTGERLSWVREGAVIRDEMRREAAAAIMRRLHARSGA